MARYMRKPAWMVGILLLLIVAIAGYVVAKGSGVPNRAEDIAGAVTSLHHSKATLTALVEENPAEKSGSAKASVRINDNTPIFKQLEQKLTRAGAGDLRKGQQVKVWFEGPVAESYPLQAKAGVVVILADET